MSKTYCGLDPSSARVTIVCLEGCEIVCASDIVIKNGGWHSRVPKIYEELMSALSHHQCKLVGVEKAISYFSGTSTIALGGVEALIILAMEELRQPWAFVNVATWKKDVVGKSRATKVEVIEWAKRLGGGEKIVNEHLADAAAIAYWAQLTDSGVRF